MSDDFGSTFDVRMTSGSELVDAEFVVGFAGVAELSADSFDVTGFDPSLHPQKPKTERLNQLRTNPWRKRYMKNSFAEVDVNSDATCSGTGP